MPKLGRTVLSNTLAQLVAKGIAVLLTLLSTFYFLRLGGPSLFGEYSQALALITIGFTAIDFGLNAHSVRSMQGPRTLQKQILADTIFARLFLSVLAVFITNLIVQFLPGGYSGEIKHIFWLGSLAIVFQGMYTSANAWFQRRLTYWKSSLVTIVATTLGTALTLYFLFTSPSLGNILFAFTIGYSAMGLLGFLLTNTPPPHLVFSRVFSLLHSSRYLGLLLFLSVLANKLDVIILGIFRSPAEVGEYSFAYRIFDVSLVLPIFVVNSVYPLLTSGKSSPRLLSTTISRLFLLGLCGTLALFFAAPLILYVRPDLHLSVTILRLLAYSLPLFYLTAPLMWDLIARRRESLLLYLYGLAALVNIALNISFIPSFGPSAAALTTIVTELLILLGLLYIRSRYVNRS